MDKHVPLRIYHAIHGDAVLAEPASDISRHESTVVIDMGFQSINKLNQLALYMNNDLRGLV